MNAYDETAIDLSTTRCNACGCEVSTSEIVQVPELGQMCESCDEAMQSQTAVFEIVTNGSWIKVDVYIFRSYTGQRRLNGRAWLGPVFMLGKSEIAVRGRDYARKGGAR